MTSAVYDAIDNSDFINLSSQHIQVLSWLYNNAPGEEAPLAQSALQAAFPESLSLAEVLAELERIGCIETREDQVTLLNQLIELPVIGQVAAGTPIEAIENHDAQMVLPLGLFRQRPTYLLRVRGDSMQDIGIMDGDIIAVRKTDTSGEGKIVVARVDNEVTVKRLKLEKNHIALMPENANYEPILVAPEDLVIEGEFVGLIRAARTLH
ncbi:MAG: transcriptional repressor LexA [Ketobacteraceae bacterium]|nr:transcriptional repressor LexA [Ketobacteraceae bacterium]